MRKRRSDMFIIVWPMEGTPQVFFSTDGTHYALAAAEHVDIHSVDVDLIDRAFSWGRDPRAPVPDGWRLDVGPASTRRFH